MRLKIFILCLVALFVSQTSRAQWVVTDPGNLAQGIINATKNIVHTSSTASTMIQNFFRELLELMFNAAALVIDTLRTFFLIVLSILGPISFAIACWDGFHASLTQWFVRYISIYLWLPVSDLFSSVLARIQVLMLQKDIEQLSDPNFIPDGSNAVYITFLIIGIIGYFTIPTVANWIIQAGGGAGNYGRNVAQTASRTGSIAAGATGAAIGNIAGRLLKR